MVKVLVALEDTVHQLFSTVPEVVAGLVALLAAFALFRIGGTLRRIETLGQAVLSAAGLGPELISRVETAFAEHRRRSINAELDRLSPVIDDERRERFERARDRLNESLLYRKRLINALALALWINLTIAGPVIALATTQIILSQGTAAVYAAMAAVLAGLTASLLSNTRVLYMLIR